MIRVPDEDFPTARDYIYLDAASISLTPKPVVDAVIEFQREVASRGTVGFSEEAETLALEGARAAAAKLIHADRDEVAILSSTTEAICAVAWSLRLEPGSNVVTTDIEFPSVTYPWIRVGRERGVEVRFARSVDGVVAFEELERLVDDRTTLLSISHVQYGSGQRFDLKRLAELAHSKGALLLVDATQSAGVVPIDVKAEDIDFLVAGSYKWLLGPFGTALFYLREEHVAGLEPAYVGWRSTENPFDFKATQLSYASAARKFEYSTMNYASAVGLAKAIEYLLKYGTENVFSYIVKLNEVLLESAMELDAKILTPEMPEERAGISTIRYPNGRSREIVRELARNKIITSHRIDAARFSPHIYNPEEDIARAVETLRVFAGHHH